MNKKLESLFDLPPVEPTQEEQQENNVPSIAELRTTLDMSKRIDNALGEVADMTEVNVDLDNLAKKAEDAFQQLMDLGSNMDDRNSGKIFEVAATMLKNAVDAKTAKLDKKLRIVELQLRKERMDRDAGKGSTNGPVIDATMVSSDRNALLDQVMKTLKDGTR